MHYSTLCMSCWCIISAFQASHDQSFSRDFPPEKERESIDLAAIIFGGLWQAYLFSFPIWPLPKQPWKEPPSFLALFLIFWLINAENVGRYHWNDTFRLTVIFHFSFRALPMMGFENHHSYHFQVYIDVNAKCDPRTAFETLILLFIHK